MMELQYERKGALARLWIHRPEALNALNRQVVDALDRALDQIAGDGEIRALIVGGGPHFAAGADIKAMVECTPDEARNFAFTTTFDKLMRLPIPTIAAIDGYALGGGLELALACDLRIAAHTAKLGMPETGLGIMPGAGGTIRLPRLVGYTSAFELICLGVQVDGARAEQLGLVNQSVPSEQLMDTAWSWAEKLSKKGPLGLKAAKQTMMNGLSCPTVEEGCALERDVWCSLFKTLDQREGMRAFQEHRKPIFHGN